MECFDLSTHHQTDFAESAVTLFVLPGLVALYYSTKKENNTEKKQLKKAARLRSNAFINDRTI